MAELRRREKEDDKRARDRVRAQIESDKAARKAKAEAAAGGTPVAAAPVPVLAKPAAPSVSKDYSETRLQVWKIKRESREHKKYVDQLFAKSCCCLSLLDTTYQWSSSYPNFWCQRNTFSCESVY